MSVPTSAAEQVHGLRHGACRDPHALLGAHPLRPGRKTGVVVRTWQRLAGATTGPAR